MKKVFLWSFCGTTKLIAFRLVAGQSTETTEEKIVFERITGVFYFRLKHLLHTTQELSVLLVTDNTLARNNKKPQTFKNSLHFEFKNLTVPRAKHLWDPHEPI